MSLRWSWREMADIAYEVDEVEDEDDDVDWIMENRSSTGEADFGCHTTPMAAVSALRQRRRYSGRGYQSRQQGSTWEGDRRRK